MAKKQEKESENIYQFKITLNYSKPPIWRRIQVPENYSFWELHCAIQDAMGWGGGHLHGFTFTNKQNNWQTIRIIVPMPGDNEFGGGITLDERKTKIADYFGKFSKQCKYEYDFGDGWVHTVLLEKIIPKISGEEYPKCLDGKLACPPDDCGGIYGYYDLIETLKNPKEEGHKDMLEWLCIDRPEDFDPEEFDLNDVVFENPKELLKEFESYI